MIIAPILNRVGDLTAPLVDQIKNAIRRKLEEAQQIARQLGEGVDNVIDDVTGRTPQVVTEGVGNVDNGRIRTPESPQKAEPLQMSGASGGSGEIAFGSNALVKFRKHGREIRANAKALGFDIPKGGMKKPEVQAKVVEFMEFIVKNGETRVGAYKSTGGGDLNALWTRYDNSIVVRRSNGEFLSFFDISTGGAAVNFPGGL